MDKPYYIRTPDIVFPNHPTLEQIKDNLRQSEDGSVEFSDTTLVIEVDIHPDDIIDFVRVVGIGGVEEYSVSYLTSSDPSNWRPLTDSDNTVT